jgi:lipopolysaccharide export system protein LptA
MPAALNSFLILLLFSALSLSVHAEKADRDKPVHLEADNVTLDDVKKLSVFQGNVLLIQGTLMMRADRIEARQNGDGLQSILASGRPVSFRQKRDGVDEYIEGFANQVAFDNVQSLLSLSGDARLRKGDDEIRGNQISYDAKTEFYKVSGQAGAEGTSGRVRVVIRPKARNQADSSAQENKNKPNKQ